MDQRKHLTDEDLQEIHTVVEKRLELLKKQEEYEDVSKRLDERRQMLMKIQEENRKLQQEVDELRQFRISHDMIQKRKEHLVQKVQMEVTEVEVTEVDLQRSKVKYDQMKQKEEEAQRRLQIQRVSLVPFLEKVVTMTQFVDVEMLMKHLENLLHLRSSLFQKDKLKVDQVEQQKKDLLTMDYQHHLDMVQAHSRMAAVRTQLDAAAHQAQIWEQKWTQIQKTSERQILELGQMKISILNLFEAAGGVVGEEGGVDMGDAETQLETIQTFIQSYDNVVRQGQRQNPDKTQSGRKRAEMPPIKPRH
ncbi:coiled-coil domain-containing protein 42-like [Sphaeramia orbicularis]|uniref:coiled-coil domain-containing protein 42-like n=1 Tax=Sphaeramia orbicularis TaxID=375764 RepID=UPI00117E973D|nr:coiled-coil domain-containing protein 42-like [Sphaeramia orbicularis]